MRLCGKHLKTLPSGRTAAMSKGGLKEACETQVMVAAPNASAWGEVMTYIPFVNSRNVFFLAFGSMGAASTNPGATLSAGG